MEKTAGEILGLVKNFKKEWERFGDCMAKMGEKLEGATAEFRKLTTTRQTKLDRSIQKIEDLQQIKGLEEVEAIEAEAEVAGVLEEGECKEKAD
jgi:DNA anti-recombination protein RmuC